MPAEPHSTWMKELLKNNHSPSDQAVREIKGFLIVPLKELEDLDAKILELKKRLSELESKRDETQKRISQYRSILASIRRIPPDVLGEIFLHCLPTHRNPILKPTECPLLLTHICKAWQTIAISSPRLWERIYITFTDDDSVPDLESAAEMVRNGRITGLGWKSAQTKSEKEHTTDVLRRRYEALKEWVSRSGTRPLSISLSFPSTYWYTVPYSKRPPCVTVELLSFLASLAPRWRHLELKISSEIYEFLEQMIKSASELTALTSLRVEYPPQFPVQNERLLHPTLFHAPRLQTIFIAIGGNITRGIDSSIRWNQLTRISCLDFLTLGQTVDLLQRSSNLIHYKGAISDPPNGIEPVPLLQEGYIILPFLRSLSIFQYASPQRVGNMYHRIDAPSLKSFSYVVEFVAPRAPAGTGTLTAVNSILPLLQRSTELQKLTIDMKPSIASPGDITTLLDATPTITELVIGFPERPAAPHVFSASLQSGYDVHGFAERDIWGFENLIVRKDSKDDEPPLLPRLTSLVILSPNARISDETLIDLIKSRMISSQTAALEHVRLISYRKRGKDIEGELTRYANLVGGKIKLNLKYPQPPVPRMRFISPEFGLDEFEDYSQFWRRYMDAGEDGDM